MTVISDSEGSQLFSCGLSDGLQINDNDDLKSYYDCFLFSICNKLKRYILSSNKGL